MATTVNLKDPPINQPVLTGSNINTIWAGWFRDVARAIGSVTLSSVSWSTIDFTGSNLTSILTRNHNDLQNIQGGAANNYYHLTSSQQTDLTDSGDCTIHFHATDRNRVNHTGSQTASTISDFSNAATSVIRAATTTFIQQLDVLTTGFTKTISNNTNVYINDSAGTLASGTFIMPATPTSNQILRICSTQAITSITHNANTGQSIKGALTTLPANGFGEWQYRTANATWYRTG